MSRGIEFGLGSTPLPSVRRRNFTGSYGPEVPTPGPIPRTYTPYKSPEEHAAREDARARAVNAAGRDYQGTLFSEPVINPITSGDFLDHLDAYQQTLTPEQLDAHLNLSMAGHTISETDDPVLSESLPRPVAEMTHTLEGKSPEDITIARHPFPGGDRIIARNPAGKVAGYLLVEQSSSGNRPGMIATGSRYMKKGLARTMFRFAQASGPYEDPQQNLRHSEIQTSLGKAYARRVPDDPEQDKTVYRPRNTKRREIQGRLFR